MTTTDTPRTDAEIWNVVYHHKNEIVVDADFARELERELAISLENQVKAQAEVERLRVQLIRAIEIQEEMCTGCSCWHCDDLRMELESIRRTNNSTN